MSNAQSPGLGGPEFTLETFSVTFFMGNCKPQTAKCHVTTALRSRLQFPVHVWLCRTPLSFQICEWGPWGFVIAIFPIFLYVSITSEVYNIRASLSWVMVWDNSSKQPCGNYGKVDGDARCRLLARAPQGVASHAGILRGAPLKAPAWKATQGAARCLKVLGTK